MGGVVEDEAGEQGAVPAGRGALRELGEDEPRQHPGDLGVAPFREVDADPQRVFQTPQRERVAAAGGVEEPGERGPVEQRDAVGEQGARVTGPGGLPFPRVEFA